MTPDPTPIPSSGITREEHDELVAAKGRPYTQGPIRRRRQVDDKTVGAGQADEAVVGGGRVQRDLGAGAGGTAGELDRSHFSRLGKIPRQRSKERRPEEDLLHSVGLHAHAG